MFLLFASTLDVEQTGWCSHHHGTTKSLHSSANYTRWQQGSKLISSSLSLSTRVNMKQHRPYLANKLSQPADFEARCHLRCASSLSLIVCHTRLSTILTARVWNSLPQHVTHAMSLSVLCSRLKTHLFRRCYPWLHPPYCCAWEVTLSLSDTLIVLVTYLHCIHRLTDLIIKVSKMLVIRSRYESHLVPRHALAASYWMLIQDQVDRSHHCQMCTVCHQQWLQRCAWSRMPPTHSAAYMYVFIAL